MAAATATWEGLVDLDSEVARLRRGDTGAFDALLARYQNRLYRYLQRLVREPATAEDLFQQIWLRVMQNIPSLDPSRNFEAWLFRIAHNLAIDHLRRHRMESLDEPLPCPSCQIVLPASYTFCPHCGTATTRICPNCGKPAERGWVNCAYCGTKLPGNGQKMEVGK